MRFYSIFVFASFFFLFSACSNKPKVSEDKKGEKSDSIANIETVKADKSLVAEWRLETVDNKKDNSGFDLTLKENGEFLIKLSAGGEVKGIYTHAEDGKKVTLKHGSSQDDWSIVELTDSILEVSAYQKEDKKENLYRFKKK
jgi:hypothetical protein